MAVHFKAMRIAVQYTVFAIIATLLNLIAQAFVFYIVGSAHPFVLHIAIAAGTLVALVTKYAFDKIWIFKSVSRSAIHTAREFLAYSATGVFTTCIFWGFEIAFHLLFEAHIFTFIGAAIGLIVGYTTKFFLDREYVFTPDESSANDKLI